MTAQIIPFGAPWPAPAEMPLPTIATPLEAELLRDQAWRMTADMTHLPPAQVWAWYVEQCDRIAAITVGGAPPQMPSAAPVALRLACSNGVG